MHNLVMISILSIFAAFSLLVLFLLVAKFGQLFDRLSIVSSLLSRKPLTNEYRLYDAKFFCTKDCHTFIFHFKEEVLLQSTAGGSGRLFSIFGILSLSDHLGECKVLSQIGDTQPLEGNFSIENGWI